MSLGFRPNFQLSSTTSEESGSAEDGVLNEYIFVNCRAKRAWVFLAFPSILAHRRSAFL